MDNARISRRLLVGAGAVGTLGLLVGPEAALADGDDLERVNRLRWDLVQPQSGVVVPGGTDTAQTAPVGNTFLTISLTGSGLANTRRRTASGGGTFVIRNASGIEPPQLGHGIYYVTGFVSFVNGGGSLVGTGLMDTIGDIKQTTGGVLTLNVHVVAATGGAGDAVLEIHCVLPGGQADMEGVQLSLPPRLFLRSTGFTLFHVLDD